MPVTPKSEPLHKTPLPRSIVMQNEMTEVVRMRGFFQAICQENDIDFESFKMLNLALEEWVANTINYAYPEGVSGEVELTAQVVDGVLTLVIKDQGKPFDPTQHAEIDVEAELEDRPIGGLGIHLVKAIMDSMHYERLDEGYNVLTLKKKLK